MTESCCLALRRSLFLNVLLCLSVKHFLICCLRSQKKTPEVFSFTLVLSRMEFILFWGVCGDKEKDGDV